MVGLRDRTGLIRTSDFLKEVSLGAESAMAWRGSILQSASMLSQWDGRESDALVAFDRAFGQDLGEKHKSIGPRMPKMVQLSPQYVEIEFDDDAKVESIDLVRRIRKLGASSATCSAARKSEMYWCSSLALSTTILPESFGYSDQGLWWWICNQYGQPS